MAGEPGFEPRLTESESVVLPLNYSPAGSGLWPARRCAALIAKPSRLANSFFGKNSHALASATFGRLWEKAIGEWQLRCYPWTNEAIRRSSTPF